MGNGGQPETIQAYLRALGDALAGPRDWRRRVLAEVEDGMLGELDARDGLAERDLVRDWGRVQDIAAEFNRSGRAIRARRMARTILGWTPILVVGWALVVQLSPDPWTGQPTLTWVFASVLFASTGAAITGAVQLARGSVGSVLAGGQVRGVACACVGVGSGVLCLAVLLGYRLYSSHWHIFWIGAIVTGLLTLMLSATVAFHGWHLAQRRN